ncbi:MULTISPECIES: restriction endonuclease [unclassified Chamaesiphon]|uniref:restriction endonuclease n=1 Tax=unclassified Chamaesiphon TaxID=2620921 RepID=UPI00286A40F3|nr:MULTISPECIES: restriction endonuclease [unclassified Chamaesiphon]
MSIPDFQSIMLPLIELASDGKEHKLSETIEHLAATHFNLTDTERKELLPSGKQARFDNRVGWAVTYLKKAGLLAYPARGKFQITPRGLDILTQKPSRIDVKYLKQFPECLDFIGAATSPATETSSSPLEQTPDETIESAYRQLRQNLAQELLERIKTASPAFFEQLVIELLVKMGYGGSLVDAGMAIGKTGDEGIDGIIKEDRLGLDAIYIQAKRWNNTVGRPEIQQFVGALAGKGARKGIFITTSKFSEQAKSYLPANVKVVLIDGAQLAEYAIEVNLGVSVVSEYQIKRLDLDYFDGE